MSRRSRLTFTLLASVLLHVGAFVVLSWGLSTDPPRRTASPSAVEMELVYQSARPAAQPAPKPEEQPPARASVEPSRRTQRQSPQPAPVTRRPEESPGLASARPEEPVARKTGEPVAPERDRPTRDDAPRAAPPLTLLPKDIPGGVPVVEPPSRGRTVRNLPGETPDAEAVAAYQAEEAKARVEGWAADSLATARAERGAVAPYFRQLRGAFSEQLVNPPSPDAAVIGSRMVREQIEAVQRFGRTGSPTVAPEQREHRLEQRNRLQAAAEAGRAANMYMVDVTAPILALAAIVEVWQEPDGKLRDLKVLESSGDPTFDSWAISRLRNALARTGSPPNAGVGIHDDGIRSRWRLEEYLGNPRVRIHLIGVY